VAGALREIGSRTVWVDEQGEGSAVVFIHGLGGTANVFDAQFTALANHHRVISFDLAGHGMSPLDDTTTVDLWAKDVVGILDACGIDTAVLVAHSLGTLIAQRVAATHLDRVNGLVLLGPIRDLADATREAQRARAATVREHGMVAVSHAISRAATSPTTQNNQPSVTAFVKELLQRQLPAGYAAACEALADSTPPDMSRFDGRTLLITGSVDAVSPAERIGELAANFKHRHCIIIDSIGHWTPLEASLEVTRMITEFLAEL
jgi:pimeloyl-ACP methyl ester carboxylesterase